MPLSFGEGMGWGLNIIIKKYREYDGSVKNYFDGPTKIDEITFNSLPNDAVGSRFNKSVLSLENNFNERSLLTFLTTSIFSSEEELLKIVVAFEKYFCNPLNCSLSLSVLVELIILMVLFKSE